LATPEYWLLVGVGSSGIPQGTSPKAPAKNPAASDAARSSPSDGKRYSLPSWPSATTAVIVAPTRPCCPSTRRSPISMIVLQHGQVPPDLDIVPAAIRLSCSRRWAVFPPTRGTLSCTPNTTPVRASLGSIVSSTRLLSFLHSQRVFSRGTVARQFLQVTVRAHRYATVGLPSMTG